MLNSCKRIYREAFGNDEPQFEERLFSLCGNCLRVVLKDGRVVAMLFLLPCKLVTEGFEYNGHYIYAAATDKEYRKKGLMSALINNVRAENNGFLLLRPANEGLIEFYKKLGFTEILSTTAEASEIVPIDEFKELITEFDSIEDIIPFKAMHIGLENLKEIHFTYSME